MGAFEIPVDEHAYDGHVVDPVSGLSRMLDVSDPSRPIASSWFASRTQANKAYRRLVAERHREIARWQKSNDHDDLVVDCDVGVTFEGVLADSPTMLNLRARTTTHVLADFRKAQDGSVFCHTFYPDIWHHGTDSPAGMGQMLAMSADYQGASDARKLLMELMVDRHVSLPKGTYAGNTQVIMPLSPDAADGYVAFDRSHAAFMARPGETLVELGHVPAASDVLVQRSFPVVCSIVRRAFALRPLELPASAVTLVGSDVGNVSSDDGSSDASAGQPSTGSSRRQTDHYLRMVRRNAERRSSKKKKKKKKSEKKKQPAKAVASPCVATTRRDMNFDSLTHEALYKAVVGYGLPLVSPDGREALIKGYMQSPDGSSSDVMLFRGPISRKHIHDLYVWMGKHRADFVVRTGTFDLDETPPVFEVGEALPDGDVLSSVGVQSVCTETRKARSYVARFARPGHEWTVLLPHSLRVAWLKANGYDVTLLGNVQLMD